MCSLPLSLAHLLLSPLRDAALTDPLTESCYSRMLPLHAQPPTPVQSDRQPTPLTRTRLYCHVRNTCHTLTLVSLSTNSIVEESNLQRTKVNGRRPRTERCGHLVCRVLLLSWQLSRQPAPRSLRFSTSVICVFKEKFNNRGLSFKICFFLSS